MKGIVMNLLAEMVESEFGMAEWNEVLQDAGLTGAYTSTGLYSDSELSTLAGFLSKRNQVPLDDLVFAFGRFIFPAFYQRYPALIDQFDSLLELLEALDLVIHVEVNKLHPGAVPPDFRCQRLSDHQVLLEYHSERQLCRLAEGMIEAAAEHYKQPYDLVHSPCLRHAGDHCGFLISLR
jgi:hypothetical protein